MSDYSSTFTENTGDTIDTSDFSTEFDAIETAVATKYDDTTGTLQATQIQDSNGAESLIITATASAVNEFTVTNAATGNNVALSASGGDTNIGIEITPKGTGRITAGTDDIALVPGVDIEVDATGSVTIGTLPSGWSMARSSTGVFTLTHNLGTTNHVGTGNVAGTTAGIVGYIKGTNSSQIRTWNTSGTLTDYPFTLSMRVL